MAARREELVEKLEVFISYAREDLAFADELVAGLELMDFRPIIDRQSIKAGEDYQTRIGGLLLSADTVIFILSPDSVGSRICMWEIEEAARLSKRILPVFWRPVDMGTLPERLGRINYIRFDERHSFAKGLKELSQALREDLGWLREHSKLTSCAAEWEARGRPEFRLLSGDDIAEAKAWRDRRPKNAPEITDAQAAYIAASEAAQTARASAERKQLEEIAAVQEEKARALADKVAAQVRSGRLQRGLLIGAVAAAVVFAVLGFVSFFAERRAAAAAAEAKAALELAETRGQEAEARRRDAETARQAEADQRKSAELARSEAERHRPSAIAMCSRTL